MTIGLLMHLTKSIHHSGRVVIIDSGFCVLKALIKLASIGGVYSFAVIKKGGTGQSISEVAKLTRGLRMWRWMRMVPALVVFFRKG
jgi:Transposase IS4